MFYSSKANSLPLGRQKQSISNSNKKKLRDLEEKTPIWRILLLHEHALPPRPAAITD
jgi:hypothetical protein